MLAVQWPLCSCRKVINRLYLTTFAMLAARWFHLGLSSLKAT